MTLVLLLLAIVIAGAFLMLERFRLDRCRNTIALRISVTGTRGKSSVTRMLASVLREDGRRVLAKTTGSEAAYILPDGSERKIHRRGRPSIMEQKRLIQMGAAMGVDTVVAEIMSIHPENHIVETHQLLQPHMVLVTNFRVDHTSAMGTTPDEMAQVMALDVAEGAKVFVPQLECLPAFRRAVENRQNPTNRAVIDIPPDTGKESVGENTLSGEFSENLDLVCAVAKSLDVGSETIRDGIEQTRRDIGALAVWRYRPAGDEGSYLLVNAFAANDPASTMIVYDKVLTLLGTDPSTCIGLMNLRHDRGDRTLQWTEALADGWLGRFKRLYLCGRHAQAVKRRLQRLDGASRIEVLRSGRPAAMTQVVVSEIRETGGVVFGFGNIGEVGQTLLDHWREVSEPLEI